MKAPRPNLPYQRPRSGRRLPAKDQLPRDVDRIRQWLFLGVLEGLDRLMSGSRLLYRLVCRSSFLRRYSQAKHQDDLERAIPLYHDCPRKQGRKKDLPAGGTAPIRKRLWLRLPGNLVLSFVLMRRSVRIAERYPCWRKACRNGVRIRRL